MDIPSYRSIAPYVVQKRCSRRHAFAEFRRETFQRCLRTPSALRPSYVKAIPSQPGKVGAHQSAAGATCGRMRRNISRPCAASSIRSTTYSPLYGDGRGRSTVACMSPTSIVGMFVVGIMAVLVTTVNLNNEVDWTVLRPSVKFRAPPAAKMVRAALACSAGGARWRNADTLLFAPA